MGVGLSGIIRSARYVCVRNAKMVTGKTPSSRFEDFLPSNYTEATEALKDVDDLFKLMHLI